MLYSAVMYPLFLPVGTFLTASGVNPKIMIFVGALVGLSFMMIASSCAPN